ncbi:MAG: helix-turn-helix transcriptional regulator [Rikenellaceae bacterium]
MTAQNSYITGTTSQFDEFKNNAPIHLDSGGFLLCTSGSGYIMVDTKQYRVSKWDLIVVFPYSYAHAIQTSEDFDGVILGVDTNLLINTEISNKSFYITSITSNPCISLTPQEAEKILALRESFLQESSNTSHPHRKEIDEAILKIMIYEIAALFQRSKPLTEDKGSRDNVIFTTFIVQLSSEETRHRPLSYYAERQSITTSHLSKVVKRVTNRSASNWIIQYTIINIKRLLQIKDLQITAIAEQMDFPNASFLAQYFKNYTSETPSQYRNNFFKSQTNG